MENIPFELTNTQRHYLGLTPVHAGWELVRLGTGEFSNEVYLYFDGNVIRKMIDKAPWQYIELELNETTTADRTFFLPASAGKEPVKLDVAATKSFRRSFYFSFTGGSVKIVNHETDRTYYYEEFERGKSLRDLPDWLRWWISGCTETDLEELATFRNAKAQYIEIREGDFFTFRMDRHRWGFGRISRIIPPLGEGQKPFGLYTAFGNNPDILLVKVYHRLSDTPFADPDELAVCEVLPDELIRSMYFQNGQYRIIGNRELIPDEPGDMIISYARTFNRPPDITWLQYGEIYREVPLSRFSKYLPNHRTESPTESNPYEMARAGYDLDIETLAECVVAGSNEPYWNRKKDYYQMGDLRNPRNYGKKKEIFDFFGLDADKTYAENLDLVGKYFTFDR